MEISSLLTHFPFLFRTFTFLDIKTGKFNQPLMFCRISCTATLTIFTIWCLTEGNLEYDSLAKIQDLLLFLMLLSNDVILIKNKKSLGVLIEFLMEPIPAFEVNSSASRIAQEFVKRTHQTGIGIMAWCTSCGFALSLVPFLSLFDISIYPATKSFTVPLEWVSQSKKPYVMIVAAYTVGVLVFLFGAALYVCFYLNMTFVVLKIMLRVQLLIADLANLDKKAEHSCKEKFDLTKAACRLNLCERCANSQLNKNKALRTHCGWVEVRSRSVEQGPRQCCWDVNKDMLHIHCLKQHLKEAIEHHVEILRIVRALNSVYNIPLLLYSQFGIFIAALVISVVGYDLNVTATECVYTVVQLTGSLVTIGVFNYMGQTVLNECEALRQAVLNCNWVDKPASFKRKLLITQTVATRPFRLTAGGMFTLSMETFTTILSSGYSYVGLLASLKKEV